MPPRTTVDMSLSLSLMLLFVLWLVVVIPSAGGVLQVTRFGGILTITKSLARAKDGFIIFPSVDTLSDRNVEIVCGRDVTFSSIPTTPSAVGDPRFNVSVSMNYVSPECSGRLSVCVGPDTVFRKRRSYLHHGLRCAAETPSVVTMPHPEVMETISPGLYTWFMGPSQYEEMRNKGATTVFIPYLNYYTFPVLVALYHPEGLKYECYFKAPRKGETKITNLRVRHYSTLNKYYQRKGVGYFTKFRKTVVSLSTYRGDYSVRCRGLYWYTPTRSAYWSPWVTQRLRLNMFKGILIRVLSPMHRKVVFPSWMTTGTMAVEVLTTSAMKEFHMERSDGVAHEQQILVEFIAYNKYNITAEYRVALPWMTEHTTGIYSISVANNDRERKKVNIRIEKAEALRVLVSPSQQIVGEGARVSFDCLVLGHPIQTIRWIRDFDSTDINPDEVPIEITKLSGDSRGLRLTFLSPKLLDSAYYACFAANQFERQQERVELAVFLPGSLYIDPNYQAPVGGAGIEGAHVLNISDEDILEEWNNSYSGDGKKGINGVAIGLSASFAVAIITVGTVIGVLLCRMVYRKRQYTRLRSITKTRKAALEPKTPLRQESRLQLIPNTFDKELDLVKEWLGSEAEMSEGGSDEELAMDCSHQGDIEGVFETLECDDDGGDQPESGASKKGKDKAKGTRAKRRKEQGPDLQGFTEGGSKGRGSSKQKAEGGDKEAKTKSSDVREKANGRDKGDAEAKSSDVREKANGKEKGEAKAKGRDEEAAKSKKGDMGEKAKSRDKEAAKSKKSDMGEKAKGRDKEAAKSKSSESEKAKGKDKTKSRTKTEGKPKGSEGKKPKSRGDGGKSPERKCEDESVEGKDGK